MQISFVTPRLVIQAIENAASIEPEGIVKILTPKATAQLPSDWQTINTMQAAQAWLTQRLVEGMVYKILERNSRKLIGFLFLYEMKNSIGTDVRLGYLLSEQYWGKGLGSELINGLITECRHQDMTTLIGGVTKENVASAKVLTKNGFILAECEGETEFYEYRFG